MRLALPPLIILAALLTAAPAVAGPPYVTDDPQPTDQGHWEIYNFVQGVHTPGETSGAAGLDLNYGAFKDVQVTAVLPLGFDGSGQGPGNVELAVKDKLVHQVAGSWKPDVSVFPRLFLPTGGTRFGTGRLNAILPVWAQKDFGSWSVFGGGGYGFNPGPGSRGYWFSGLAVTDQVTRRLNLGAEVYQHTADADDAKPFTGLNLGVTYRMTGHWSLLAAGGPGLQNPRAEGQYSVYLSLKADY